MGELQTHLQSFKATLQGIAALPDDEFSFLSRHAVLSRYRPGEVLLEIGEVPDRFWYLPEGFLRFFYVTEDGREFNKAFPRPGEIVVPLTGLRTGRASAFAITAVTEAAAVALPLKIIPQLYDRHWAWERIGRVLAEEMAMRKEAREREFLQESALNRYRRFALGYPELIGVIPQRQIASFIGVTEQALSRILRAEKTDSAH